MTYLIIKNDLRSVCTMPSLVFDFVTPVWLSQVDAKPKLIFDFVTQSDFLISTLGPILFLILWPDLTLMKILKNSPLLQPPPILTQI